MKAMICVILDRSGSMGGRESDVVGGVNKFIDEQRKLPDPASIAMVRFDTGAIERFRPMVALHAIEKLTMEDFQPRGGTPLLDAIGTTITQLDEDWKREQPEGAIVVIVTDGQENSSREYSKSRIKQMIEARQKSGKWAFIYLAANVDAFEEGAGMGIARSTTAGYNSTPMGTQAAYGNLNVATSAMRSSGVMDAQNLGRNISDDEALEQPVPATPQSSTWQPPQGAN